MADQNDQSNTNSTYNQRRRSSFVGQAFTDMFSRSSRPSESSGNSPPAQGPITTAAAEASRRRLSVSTLGMSASPNQGSPMSARMRGESVSSSTVDESAIDDEPSSATPGNSGPFARRVSFGARALKDMKGGSASVPAGRPTATITIPEEEVVDGEKKTLAPTSSSLGRRGLCLFLVPPACFHRICLSIILLTCLFVLQKASTGQTTCVPVLREAPSLASPLPLLLAAGLTPAPKASPSWTHLSETTPSP